ncbi:hypothetical protein, partial [Paenibacillus graminis]|uniref:hypothetical protein n=1 Tax=Paenibacillus graminis TaxID=189425 RepID=UPI00056CC2F9
MKERVHTSIEAHKPYSRPARLKWKGMIPMLASTQDMERTAREVQPRENCPSLTATETRRLEKQVRRRTDKPGKIGLIQAAVLLGCLFLLLLG